MDNTKLRKKAYIVLAAVLAVFAVIVTVFYVCVKNNFRQPIRQFIRAYLDGEDADVWCDEEYYEGAYISLAGYDGFGLGEFILLDKKGNKVDHDDVEAFRYREVVSKNMDNDDLKDYVCSYYDDEVDFTFEKIKYSYLECDVTIDGKTYNYIGIAIVVKEDGEWKLFSFMAQEDE